MDTFEQMLNEDIASFLKGVASSAKDRTKHALKQFGNDMLADLGSHSAAGRYDLAATAREVMDEWKYFAAQQQARPTVSGVVEFFRTSIGITMDEDQAFRAIYGTAAETVNKPPRPADDKQKTIANAFRKLVNPKTLDAKVSELANGIAKEAQQDQAIAAYVSSWMNFIGAKAPQTLKRPSMKPLHDYAHGGLLSKEQMQQLFTGIAKILLKQQMAAQDGQETSAAPESDAAVDGGAKEPGNTGPLQPPSERKQIADVAVVARQIAQVTPLFATAQLDQYFKNIAADKETIQPDDIKSRMKVETMNAVTALAMQFAVRQPYPNFHALMMEVQNGNNWWPERYYRAAYDFVRKGGDANLVAPELNRFLKNPEKAGLIMLVLLRFEGLRRKEKLAGGQPAADEGEAA